MQHITNKQIISFFWQHIKPYKWFYVVILIAPIVGSWHPFAYHYCIKLFLDTISSKSNNLSYHDILLPIFMFIMVDLVLNLVWRISNIAEWKSEPFVRRSIMLNTYDYIQHHSYLFFQENFTGSISSKVKSILDGYDKFFVEMRHGMFLCLLKVIINLCALVILNIKLGIFIILWVIVYIPVTHKLSIALNQASFHETESRHFLIGQIADKITNIISLFSFASRKMELKLLDKHIVNDFIPKQMVTYKRNFRIQIITGILYSIMIFCFLFFIINLRMNGLITIGDFAFAFSILMVILDDIWNVTLSLQSIARALGDLRSSLAIIYLKQQNLDKPNAKALIIKTPKIEFKNVSFTYDKGAVLKNLNLVINPGEKVGLVGHSGAGKSTIINLIMRYFTNTQGEILIDNQNISDVTQDSLREQIAVIPQDTTLFHRTLIENIKYGKQSATDEEVIEASKKAHIHEFILTLPNGYYTYVGERGMKLSGGQRQRIAIARAILKDAPILILDEATSSLDSQTEKLIQESLNFLIEDKKKTVIAVAHRLSTLKHMDRIIVLDKGKIIEQGTHHKLIRTQDSLYKKLWELQEIQMEPS